MSTKRLPIGASVVAVCMTLSSSPVSWHTSQAIDAQASRPLPEDDLRLRPAKALVKPLAIHGSFLLTRAALERLPDAGEIDDSLAAHDLDDGLDSPPIRDSRTVADGILGLGPVVPTWEPGDKIGTMDPQIAVGQTHVVLAAWDHWGIYTKDGALVQVVKAKDFFAELIPDINAHLNVPNIAKYGIDRFFDTRLIFDDYRGRFWVVTLAKQESTDRDITKTATDADLTYRRAKVLVGVSATGDPTGDWYRYWWDGQVDDGICNMPNLPPQTLECPNSTFRPGDGHDFAFIGVSKSHFMEANGARYVYLSVAPAEDLASGQVPQGGFDAWQYTKIQFLDGMVVTTSLLQPAVHHGPDDPSGSWLLSARRDGPESKRGKLDLWLLKDTSPPVLYTIPLPFKVGRQSRADQLGHPNVPNPRRLETYPASFVMKAIWRAGSLYAVVPDCREWSGATECMAAIKLIRLGLFAETPVIDRTFGKRNEVTDPPDALFSYFLPSMEVNKFGDMAVVYQRSGPTIWPEVRLSVRLAKDSDMRPSLPLRFGEFPVGGDATNDKPYDNIDVAGMAVDPFDDQAIWMVHGYGYPKNGDAATATSGMWRLVVGKVFGSRYPDLLTTIGVVLAEVSTGDLLSADLTISNQGDGAANDVTVEMYLTGDDLLRVPIGEVKLGSIESGGKINMAVHLTIPRWVAPGRYRLLAVADPLDHLQEYNEVNNSATSDLFTVVASEPIAGDARSIR